MVRFGQTTSAALRETVIGGDFAAIAERPGNQHRHDDGFAAAGRHLAAVTNEFGEVRKSSGAIEPVS